MFIVAVIFFPSIPDIDIGNMLSEYKSLLAKMDNIEAVSTILKNKQNDLSYFVLLLKVIATIFLYVAMFTASYLFYTYKKAHVLTEAGLLPEQEEHLQMLHDSGIDIRLLAESNLKEVATITRDLSNNFVIIDTKEVAFAYPRYGEFRFAVNIIRTSDRESIRYFRDYQRLFEEMYNRSIKWSPTGCA